MKSRAIFLFAALFVIAPALAEDAQPDGASVSPPAAGPNIEPATEPRSGPTGAFDPSRFADRPADAAYGAYQRGYYLTALELAKPLAEAGNPHAQTLIGEIYMRGMGMSPNVEQAKIWYEKAAAQNIAEAKFQLAMILIDGNDVEQAHKLMKEAADAGHGYAQFNYAQILASTHDENRNDAEIVSYFERAADAGLADAQYAMSQIEMYGIGGKQASKENARRWLEESARQGLDTAQIELGTLLVQEPDETKQKEGFGWLMRAAAAGNPAAQNRVAKLYRAGIGTEPDRIEAASWYLRARRAGLIDVLMEDQLEGLTEEELSLATMNSDRLN